MPWYGLGNVYYGLKSYNEAIHAFHKAIDIDPDLAYPWYGLGIVYFKTQVL